MIKYRITILYNNDERLPYILEVPGLSQEEAIKKAKTMIAKNGWFPGRLTQEEIIAKLSVKEITEV